MTINFIKRKNTLNGNVKNKNVMPVRNLKLNKWWMTVVHWDLVL